MSTPIVLIIEDEVVVAEIISRALSMHKFACEVVRATSGEEGIAHFTAHVEQGRAPAALMVDHALGGMSGAEVLAEIAACCNARNMALPPAIYMSGYDLQSEGAAPAYAPLEFVTKPFSVADILPLARDFFKLRIV